MELGIRGRKAIVCASSQGLGRACAEALAREGVSVIVNGRDRVKLEATAKEIAEASGVSVTPIVADLNVQAERERLIEACPDADILLNNNAGPPPGRFEDWDHAQWLAALEANLLAPAMMIRGLLPGMKERGFGRIVNITSAMVKTPKGPMALSTTARTGLTALCKSISADAVKHNVTINNLDINIGGILGWLFDFVIDFFVDQFTDEIEDMFEDQIGSMIGDTLQDVVDQLAISQTIELGELLPGMPPLSLTFETKIHSLTFSPDTRLGPSCRSILMEA